MSASRLPGLLGEIADIAGRETAFLIACAYGGTRVDIPAKVGPDHWLSQIVGFDTAQLICERLAIHDADGRVKGVRHELIPRGPASLQKTAQRRVIKALNDGSDVRSAARAAGVHERTVWRIKKALGSGNDDDQLELF
nr:MAG TPA: Mor transcription activator family [Caudoviricetes sp.]